MTISAASTRQTSAPLSWRIAELAAHFDITTRAIRFYEDKGLISPARIGGHRVFNAVDKARLEKILRAKRIGFHVGRHQAIHGSYGRRRHGCGRTYRAQGQL